ncbi:MAG TPA: hypothetical protein VH475_01195 [Tepidisphaeraceae bacterium]|jgi:hypothetical protein
MFQWLQMRISEEKDRRKKEQATLERLPRALEEVGQELQVCIKSYAEAFGPQAADIVCMPHKLRVTVRDEVDGKWQSRAKVEVTTVPELPGLKVERGDEPFMIEVGLLPGGKLYFRDRVADKYLTMEEVTKNVLDRAMFPKLGE